VLLHFRQELLQCSIVEDFMEVSSLLPAGRALRVWPAGPKIALRSLRLLVYLYIYIFIYLCVRTYHMCNNYVTYIVDTRPLLH